MKSKTKQNLIWINIFLSTLVVISAISWFIILIYSLFVWDLSLIKYFLISIISWIVFSILSNRIELSLKSNR